MASRWSKRSRALKIQSCAVVWSIWWVSVAGLFTRTFGSPALGTLEPSMGPTVVAARAAGKELFLPKIAKTIAL